MALWDGRDGTAADLRARLKGCAHRWSVPVSLALDHDRGAVDVAAMVAPFRETARGLSGFAHVICAHDALDGSAEVCFYIEREADFEAVMAAHPDGHDPAAPAAPAP